ncbi:hypothetical protein [Paenibacillus radicis (ex Xue et al. 2023)]|uniref:Ferric oxidoreductase domain-containing protein n=1 Tax=Paenibacillus radicis (ex Xue et al. 2023) TaxID=2972489 RepID=A0ABT1YJM0_9BACL|nr:hypothetical protein [Paenibacillus radicis (ex Xue et al. 2023)]MCR8632175.1 hypothetical protein [Paenibacillus radicis (ex Xue et al. 2023)]
MEQLAKGEIALRIRIGILFNDMGTIAVYLGAVCISLLWLKRKLRSPSKIVRRIGKLFLTLHNYSGWAALIFVCAHGIYFMLVEIHDQHIYSGIASFIIMLTIAGYGYSIRKIRNKWMRVIHRCLSIVWIPVLWIHAGWDLIFAAILSLVVLVLVIMVEKAMERSHSKGAWIPISNLNNYRRLEMRGFSGQRKSPFLHVVRGYA